ncbi:M20 family peptidase [Clostridium sp. C8-1-8]|uniref:M20 family peptidase n=1 Tax=Clostridium sp. C8-1-8 TaxID=2698831 RepID=UPI00136CB48B|nr:M20 family peptidase [Clostridium sp. C8-1-8]
MKYILMILLALILIFIAVIIFRAMMFKPKTQEKVEDNTADIDENKAAAHLAEMIRCKTVSRYDSKLIDEAEFDKFRALLPKLYPNVFSNCSYERVGNTGILIKWIGKASLNPTVLMSHYDVVPVIEDKWEKPPFAGVIEDGVLWGRGTLDTKGTLCGVMESVEHLVEKGFIPENDVYLAFSGDEEINGPSAPAIVEELKRRGIQPALVLDEGGAVVEGVFPGLKQPCALIGIGEKGPMNLELSAKGNGGHASAPPPHTLVGLLAKAVVNIEKHPFKAQFTKPAAEMFETLGRYSSFAYKIIFANLWCFKPLLDLLCKKKGGELNALMRTTCAPTMMEGSSAPNVLAPQAKVVANLRLIGKDTPETAVDYLKKVISDDNIELEVMDAMNPSPYSKTEGESWDKLSKAIKQTWPSTIVSPYLMVACSDSRHYCRISENVYRFSAMALSKEERSMIHGHNERVPVSTIGTTVKFYIRLIGQL